jgi:hypothetical protein
MFQNQNYKKIKFKTKKSAFTLVESLLYLALFATIFVTIIEFSFLVSRYNKDAEIHIVTERSVVFVNQHIIETFKTVQSIDEVNSTFDSNSSVITLNTASGSIKYSVLGNRLVVTKAGQNYFLSGIDYTVEKFYAEKVKSAKDVLIGIRLSVTVRSVKNTNVSKSMQTSFIF